MMPAFKDPEAERLWVDYFAEVDRLTARAGTDAVDLGEELRAHLAESYARGDRGLAEEERLRFAMARLGRPAEYLHPLLADELLDRGSRTYNPAPIARGLYHAVRAGSSRAIVGVGFALGYLLLAVFAAMALLKPVWGEHVGLFRHPDRTLTFGIVAGTEGAREMLGLWTIPIALTMTLVIYLILTKVLRFTQRR